MNITIVVSKPIISQWSRLSIKSIGLFGPTIITNQRYYNFIITYIITNGRFIFNFGNAVWIVFPRNIIGEW